MTQSDRKLVTQYAGISSCSKELIGSSFKDDLSEGKDVVANSQNVVISLVE